jgi:hypothetical protein
MGHAEEPAGVPSEVVAGCGDAARLATAAGTP